MPRMKEIQSSTQHLGCQAMMKWKLIEFVRWLDWLIHCDRLSNKLIDQVCPQDPICATQNELTEITKPCFE